MTEKDIKNIWQEFHNSLLFFIKKRTKNSDDANDILQEVFIKISGNIGKIDSREKLSPWIYRITKNSIIDYWRTNKKNRETSLLEFDPAEINEENNPEHINSISSCINRMLKVLPKKYSVVFNLYENQKLTHQQIAEKLNISVSGSKTRLQRAREKLKSLLVQYCRVETDTYGNLINSCADESVCNNCGDLN